MGRINVLGFDVANLIAAGEVVDRPSSVVKELTENSIDSGATSITVEIQRGGVAFIRVSDNGCGIEPDDLPVAILRHATSKIHSAEDLQQIGTLGFRGEALAAIASVSRLRIFSKTAEAAMGAILTAEGGEVVDITEAGCADGTTVVVEELFYNVPARRKFLKKDATEAAAVGALAERIALSRPDIAVKFISDGDIRSSTSGNGNLREAIYSVFGRDAASRMIEVSREADGVSVTGYVSEPDFLKSNRNMENFFVNGRYVKSKTATAALEQAYRTRIPQEKFPFCVLNIDISPAAVDVNVHPAKLEIKFTNERIIFESVYYAVLSALESRVSRPELKLFPDRSGERHVGAARGDSVPQSDSGAARSEKRKGGSSFWIDGDEARRLLGAFVPADARPPKPPQVHIPYREAEDVSQAPSARSEASAAASELPQGTPESVSPSGAHATPADELPETSAGVYREAEAGETTGTCAGAAPQDAGLSGVPDYIILGEAYNCYVIVQLEDRLLFVDKHAAHERIIFDELCRRMRTAERTSQLLMVPIRVNLLEIEANAASEFSDKITATGFCFELEGSGSGQCAVISAIPDMLSSAEAVELFSTLVTRLADVGAGADAAAEEFFARGLFQASCKAAIKGGRVYDMAHIRWICDRLLVEPENGGSAIRTCPHGRPVAFEVKRSSIDRQFARLT